jgi:taurine dioxygenase
MSTTTTNPAIGVRRLAGHIGAEITGIDIAQPLDEAVVQQLRDALHTHKVIFFRDQQLGHAEQIAFARQFGEVTHAHPHEDAPPESFPEILTIDPRRYEQKYGKSFKDQYQQRQYTYFGGWHTDVTAVDQIDEIVPPGVTLARADNGYLPPALQDPFLRRRRTS